MSKSDPIEDAKLTEKPRKPAPPPAPVEAPRQPPPPPKPMPEVAQKVWRVVEAKTVSLRKTITSVVPGQVVSTAHFAPEDIESLRLQGVKLEEVK